MPTKCPKCDFDNPDTGKFCAECGTQLSSLAATITLQTAPTSPGKTIAGKYQILAELGRGGMGVVYKAKDTRLKRTVALKFLLAELTKEKEAKKRFIQEAQAAAALEHPNICTVYEVDEAEGQTFISMSYIDGQSLKDKFKDGPLDIDEAKDIALQVAEGLNEAHEKGIVHRDIKPANIMLTKKGQAKITDFGLAKLSWGVDLTKTSTIMGTVAYMSPEQARGEEVDHRSDIWSLGAMLYEMLAGERPFIKDHEQGLIFSILNDEPKPIKSFRPDVLDYIVNVINKTLAKAVAHRFQSVDEIIEALERSPSIKISEPENSIAVLPFADMSPNRDQAYFCDGIAEEIINRLTQIEDFRVVARTSSFSFKDKDVDIEEIGKKLRVDKVLEGSVRKAASRLRITVQLINVTDGYHLWSEQFDRDMEDIFSIQDEISLAISDKLKGKVSKLEKAKLTKHATDNPAAFDLYLKGNQLLLGTELEMKKGIEYIQQAIAKDPTYALAYTSLANHYSTHGHLGFMSPKEAYQKASKAAEKALELDSTLAEAHVSVAAIRYLFEWDWNKAEQGYQKAIKLNPESVINFHYIQYLTLTLRFEEAIASALKLVELDPLSPMASFLLSYAYGLAGIFDKGIDCSKKTLELDPTNSWAHLFLALFYAFQEKHSESVYHCKKAEEFLGADPSMFAMLSYSYGVAGKSEKVQGIIRQLDKLSRKRYVDPANYVWPYASLGEKDLALKYLLKAYKEKSPVMTYLKINAQFEWKNISTDSRYQDLLKKMAFPEV